MAPMVGAFLTPHRLGTPPHRGRRLGEARGRVGASSPQDKVQCASGAAVAARASPPARPRVPGRRRRRGGTEAAMAQRATPPWPSGPPRPSGPHGGGAHRRMTGHRIQAGVLPGRVPGRQQEGESRTVEPGRAAAAIRVMPPNRQNAARGCGGEGEGQEGRSVTHRGSHGGAGRSYGGNPASP